MNKYEENSLTMYGVVDHHFESNVTLVSSLTALNTAVSVFHSNINQIKIYANILKTSTSGKTLSKENAKDNLINFLVPLAASLFAYASHNNLEEIKAKSNVTPASLNALRDIEISMTAKLIYDLLNDNLTAIADFGVNAAKMTELNTKIGDFNEAMGIKSGGFTSKSAARKALTKLFHDTDKLLREEIDKLMENFKQDNKTFYDEYQSARIIHDLGLGHEEKITNTAASTTTTNTTTPTN
jgi:hypothetical protein